METKYLFKETVKGFWKQSKLSFREFLIQETKTNALNRERDDSPVFGFRMTIGETSTTPKYDELFDLVLDFDDLSVEQVQEIYDYLILDNKVAFAYESYSGEGLRVAYKTNSPILSAENYRETVYVMTESLSKECGLELLNYLDKTKAKGNCGWYLGKNIKRLYLNDNPERVSIIVCVDGTKKQRHSHRSDITKAIPTDFKLKVYKKLVELKDQLTGNYNMWLEIGIMLKNEGFTLEDWQNVSWDEAKDLCESKWESFNQKPTLTFNRLVGWIRNIEPYFFKDWIEVDEDKKLMYILNWIKGDVKEDIFQPFIIEPLYRYYINGSLYIQARFIKESMTKTLDFPADILAKSDQAKAFFYNNEINIQTGNGYTDILYNYLLEKTIELKYLEMGVTDEGLTLPDFHYTKEGGEILPIKDSILEKNGLKYLVRNEYENELFYKKCFKRETRAGYDLLPEFTRLLSKSFKYQPYNFWILSYMTAVMIRDKVLEQHNDFPILAMIGSAYTGKTTVLSFFERIFNLKKICSPTAPNLYRKQSNFINFPMPVDDLNDIDDNDKFLEFFKHASKVHQRDRMRQNGVDSPEFKNSVVFTTNHPVLDEQVLSRQIVLDFTQISRGTEDDFFELKDFVNANAFDILLCLYDRIKDYPFEEIERKIRELNKVILKLEKGRVAEIYSILTVIGISCGFDRLFDLDQSAIIEGINVNTNDDNKQSFNDDLLDAFEACVKEYEIIEEVKANHWIEIGNFTKYLIENKIIEPFKTTATVGKMIKVHPILVSKKHNNKKYVVLRLPAETQQK